VVSATLLGEEELQALPAVAGFDTRAALRVDLGGLHLARQATLRLSSPVADPLAARLLLARWVELAADGRPTSPNVVNRAALEVATEGRPATLVFAPPVDPPPSPASSTRPLPGARGDVAGRLATGIVRASSGVGLELARSTPRPRPATSAARAAATPRSSTPRRPTAASRLCTRRSRRPAPPP